MMLVRRPASPVSLRLLDLDAERIDVAVA